MMMISFNLLAQQEDLTEGSLEIIQDERLDWLLIKHSNQSSAHHAIDGFRIQIFFDSGNKSRTYAYEVRDRFLEKHPGQPVYVSFNEPYYRVRVGDFRTRLEAEGFLRKIRPDYPNCFTITEEINPPRL